MLLIKIRKLKEGSNSVPLLFFLLHNPMPHHHFGIKLRADFGNSH